MVKIKVGIDLNILAPPHFDINSHKAFQSHLRGKKKSKLQERSGASGSGAERRIKNMRVDVEIM